MNYLEDLNEHGTLTEYLAYKYHLETDPHDEFLDRQDLNEWIENIKAQNDTN